MKGPSEKTVWLVAFIFTIILIVISFIGPVFLIIFKFVLPGSKVTFIEPKITVGHSVGGVLMLVLLLAQIATFIYGIIALKKKSSKLVVIYAIVMLVLIFITIVLFIPIIEYFKAFKDHAESAITLKFGEAVGSEKARKEFDDLQQEFQCCGTHSYRDYAFVGRFVPNSCCRDPKKPDGKYFQTGCIKKVQTVTDLSLVLLFLGLIIGVGMMLVVSGFSFRLHSIYEGY